MNAGIDFVVVVILDDLRCSLHGTRPTSAQLSFPRELTVVEEVMHEAAPDLSNVKVHGVSLRDFKGLLRTKLGLEHPMQNASETWARKLPDMKMLSALLFGQFLTPRHRYWGYCDMDVIWGNVSRFAHWFQGDFPAVKTNPTVHGPAQFFANEDRFIRLYLNEKYVNTTLYLSLLTHETNYNLDEVGMWTGDRTNYRLAIHWVMAKYFRRHKLRWNGEGAGLEEIEWARHNRCPRGFVFMDEDSALHKDWSVGPVLWSRGSLRLVCGSELYPAGREVMLFHRPRRYVFAKKPSQELKRAILDDMLRNGFLLPIWTPVGTSLTKEYEAIRMYDRRVAARFQSKACNQSEGDNTTEMMALTAALRAWQTNVLANKTAGTMGK